MQGHMLIFRIDIEASETSEDSVKRWHEFTDLVTQQPLIDRIKGDCKRDNRILSYLENLEDGRTMTNEYPFLRENDIILNETISDDSERWTYGELDDLMNAFVGIANHYMGSELRLVNGYIRSIWYK